MLTILKFHVYTPLEMNHQYLLSGLLASSLLFAACKKSEETASSTTDTSSTPAAPTAPTAPAVPETVVAKELAGKAHIMKDGEYVETQIKNADYYLLYFTASW